ncbi:MAG TPA: hypothetical protein VHY37_03660 [Tepidisphaeraceae bacterium]|nr:hypothetical protein [Tepidisphaeraceae bacterium]
MSRRDIIEIARVGDCPKQYFTLGLPLQESKPTSIPLAGDIIAALAARFGADRVAKWLARCVGAKSCGCARRQAKLNRMHAAARKWLAK